MLAGIGIIICIKQLPIALGVAASGEPLEILTDLPHLLAEANPAIAVIGISSLVIMFAWPACVSPWPFSRKVPAPIVVLLVAMPAGYGFDLLHEHSYYLQGTNINSVNSSLSACQNRFLACSEMLRSRTSPFSLTHGRGSGQSSFSVLGVSSQC